MFKSLSPVRIVLAAFLLCVPACHATPVVYLSAPSTLYLGSSFDAYVAVANFPYDIGGYQLDIAYDPSVLQVTNVQEGNFLSATGSTLFDPGTTDNTVGRVNEVYGLVFGTPSSAAGGTLTDITFNNIGSGTNASPGSSVNTSISIQNLILFDTDGNLLTQYRFVQTAQVQEINNPFYTIPPYTPPAVSFTIGGNNTSVGPPAATPEPSSLLLMASGLLFGSVLVLRQRSKESTLAA